MCVPLLQQCLAHKKHFSYLQLFLLVVVIITVIKELQVYLPSCRKLLYDSHVCIVVIKRTIYVVLYSLQSIFIYIISCDKRMFLTLGNGATTYLIGQAWKLSLSHPTANHQLMLILTCKYLLIVH